MERLLALDRFRFPFALAVATIAALALAGCGRRGTPELPPNPAVQPAPSASAPGAAPRAFIDPTTPTGGPQETPVQTASQAKPAAPPAEKKTFFLDFLLQ